MINRAFSCRDICRILEASKGLNLKAIEFESLKISFHIDSPKEDVVETRPHTSTGQLKVTEDEDPNVVIPTNELSEIIDEIAEENFMIHDPAGYEKQLLDERVYGEESGEPNGRGSEIRRS